MNNERKSGGCGMGRGMGRGRSGGHGRRQGMGSTRGASGKGRHQNGQWTAQSNNISTSMSSAWSPAILNKSLEQGKASSRVAAMVNKDRCSGCGICIAFCSARAITINDVAFVDSGKCIACGACILECPTNAISLVQMRPQGTL